MKRDPVGQVSDPPREFVIWANHRKILTAAGSLKRQGVIIFEYFSNHPTPQINMR